MNAAEVWCLFAVVAAALAVLVEVMRLMRRDATGTPGLPALPPAALAQALAHTAVACLAAALWIAF